MKFRRTLLAAVSAVLMAASACGGDEPEARPSPSPDPATVALPAQLLGLQVKKETISGQLDTVTGSYLDSLGLFSFRTTDDLLRASLQVGRFNQIADNDKRRFRNAIIGQLGSTVPREVRMGDRPVFLTTGNQQNIFVWFGDKGFYVLSVREDYDFPRTLLRRLVEAEVIR